jgi:hypothetical protein
MIHESLDAGGLRSDHKSKICLREIQTTTKCFSVEKSGEYPTNAPRLQKFQLCCQQNLLKFSWLVQVTQMPL